MSSKQEERFKAMRQEAEDNIKTHAARLFSQKTLAKTTMQDIAKAAGVSTGLAYRYFPSKQALFNSIIEDASQGLANLRDAFLREGDPKQIMMENVVMMWQSMHDEQADQDLFWLVSQSLFPRTAENEAIDKLMVVDRELIQAIAAVIERGQKKGEFKDGDPDALAAYLASSYQGIGMFAPIFADAGDNLTPEILLRFLFD